jgi:hypothetical protein
MDGRMIEDAKKKDLLPTDITLLPPGGGWLLVEFGCASKQEAVDQARGLMEELNKTSNPPHIKLFDDARKAADIWLVREAALGATGRVPGEPDAWPGWEDSAVPPDKVGGFLRDLRRLLERYDYRWAFYGQARAELLPRMYGDELVEAFNEFKAIWDPEGKMNPGKMFHPYRIDENLRLGTDYHPAHPQTYFSFIEDQGSLARATLRCDGFGKCRRMQGGTMCPSFMVTREEKYSTRGRARLLLEMLQGNPLEQGWRSKAVKDALDLCLACKGCKGDCPVNVDMASYKAEFLSHYYHERLPVRVWY